MITALTMLILNQLEIAGPSLLVNYGEGLSIGFASLADIFILRILRRLGKGK